MPGTKDGTPPRWLPAVNRVVRVVQRLGAPVAVLELTGRRTGKRRRTPVSPMEWDGVRYVVAGYPSAQWVHNARAAGVGVLAVGRRRERVRLVELPAERARPVLREFPVRVPSAVSPMVGAGVVPDGSPDAFEGLAGRCAVFRLEPDR
ncbi:MAG TPA: nitroreductase/quinone reductase family protein [Pseudonocardia sp.]|nr:nitroreductase/quinone reductase family protein [Pseudonocardia sp.]